MSDSKSTATATLRCSDGCIEIEYRAKHLAPDVDARDFLNELGTPAGIDRKDGTVVCPNCDGGFSVNWGGTPQETTTDQQVAGNDGDVDA
jgi:hypothetical protein